MPADRSAAPVPPTEGTGGADADRERFVFGADPVRDRWWGRPLAETRWCFELGRLLADPVWHGIGVPHGDGRPVDLDARAFWPAIRPSESLRRGCGGSATGPASRALSPTPIALTARLTASSARSTSSGRAYGRRVALIGHSRGGHFARALAARRPDRVSHAISIGADLQGMFGASTPTLFAVNVARRAVHAGGRARRDTCLSAHCGCPFSHDYARPFPFERVRLTSVYSKGDGVVHWQCQVIPHADCVEVTGSHVGLIFNRKVYRAVGSALALPELSTTPIRCRS